MENQSCVLPLDLRGVVRPDPAETITKGGIIIPDSTAEMEKAAKIKATLVAVGVNAWEEAAARSAKFRKPEPGDRVMIAKYGGILFKSADGTEYRIMNDEDIIGLLAE